MKKVLISCMCILTLSIFLIGKNYWNEQIEFMVVSASTVADAISASAETQVDRDVNEKVKVKKLDKLLTLPSVLKPTFIEKINNNKPVNMLILSSHTFSGDEAGWPGLLKGKLEEIYSNSLIKTTKKELAGKTSEQILSENLYKELAGTKPDILLVEPFLLNDGGEIQMKGSLENLDKILGEFQKQNPDIQILLQPSNPYVGVEYEKDLKEYSIYHGYIYLNHWAVWPDKESEELKDYLTDENQPNAKGNEVWAQYLIDYFVRS
ncbi:hypothetical protein A6P54_12870 [Bacillus sp. MKU004]|nr:hypothetical protein A6P54_12870 [Bacillus sp. MKU004]